MTDDPVKNKHAAALAALGAAKGGQVRASRLTPEQRSEIARQAAEAKWQKAGVERLPRAAYGSPDHPLRIGDIEIPCYVLDDGTRVLAMGGMLRSLNMSVGSAGKTGQDRLASFVTTQSLKPFVSEDLLTRITNPIKFRRPDGGNVANGYEATILADLCDAVLAARKAGVLLKRQEHIATQCEILVRAFARVGIIALVDEATGYQEYRARNALAEILEKFVAKELRKWVRTFPNEFYKEMFRLQAWEYSEETFGTQRPRMAGKITDDIIYQRLAPGVRDELRRVIPRNEKGRLKYALHRRLTDDVGHPKLREHLAVVVALMQVSEGWDEFTDRLDRVRPRFGANYRLPLNGDGTARQRSRV